jgi:flagellin-like protein
MKTKKGQTEIIVTVLLVLIALAAVIAVAYFFTGSVNKGTAAAQDKADCLKVSIVLESAKATYVNGTTTTYTDLKISRQNDDVALKEIKVYLNDKYVGSTATIPTKLETTTVNVVNVSTNVTVGSKVRINPVLNSTGYICEGNNEQLAIA